MRNRALYFLILPLAMQTVAPSETSPSFTIAISAPQATVKPDEKIRVHIALTNISNKTLTFRSSPSKEMAEMFETITVHDKNGNGVPETERGRSARQHEYSGSVGIYWLKPGETWEEDTILNKLFDLSQPGEYEIQMSRHLSDDPGKEIVTSNKITITVAE